MHRNGVATKNFLTYFEDQPFHLIRYSVFPCECEEKMPEYTALPYSTQSHLVTVTLAQLSNFR